MSVVGMQTQALDTLLPMHVLLDRSARIIHVGPAFRRQAGTRSYMGRSALKVFAVSRPADIVDAESLLGAVGRRLHLRLLEGRGVQFRGVLVSLSEDGGALINLTLALSELSDLGGGGLTNSDFSPTDMTVDMLYLIEAKAAAMAESRRLIDRLQGAKSAAEEQAVTDMLTGLRNRRALETVLRRMLADNVPFSLCRVDLDFFKQVNDTEGHAAGDLVLEAVARALNEVTRSCDTVARVGGDEFVVLFDAMTDRTALERIGERMIEKLERPVLFEGRPCRISGSLGTAISTDYAQPEAERMMADADRALYQSKQEGRGRHTIFSPDAPLPVPQLGDLRRAAT
ncbi:diguanylate cyclase (GGDEF)-like protein [Palleronia aestuarii]|uniref:Diguanylate cyclase (GGDEF)-like protein n=1 Tax=Palleronia aestuarii TaxID=568105 RepID=A0A2W7N7H2_9RHOB|nr:GGDEF domain-containing protein [Palleronia aestuarii]PZX16335.1 diguanylate cyclase (GGDEF)-like protein [Palleronia aestuarii]